MTKEEKMRKAISVLIDCADAAKGTEFADYYRMGADAIRAQQEQESKPQWISVKDRLPDYFTCVLVWCPKNACVYAAYRNARNEWHIFDDSVAGRILANKVTHWMPPPEPPKEE